MSRRTLFPGFDDAGGDFYGQGAALRVACGKTEHEEGNFFAVGEDVGLLGDTVEDGAKALKEVATHSSPIDGAFKGGVLAVRKKGKLLESALTIEGFLPFAGAKQVGEALGKRVGRLVLFG